MGVKTATEPAAATVVVALDNTYEGMGSKGRVQPWPSVVHPASECCRD